MASIDARAGRGRSRGQRSFFNFRCMLLQAAALLVVVLIPLGAAQYTTACAQVVGDVNCDGALDVSDMADLGAVLFEGALSGCSGADVNADGVVSAADTVALAQALGAPLPSGPAVTFFGVTGADGHAVTPLGTIGTVLVFARPVGSGFKLVVEASRGTSGLPPGMTTFDSNPHNPLQRPDLQIESTNPLGDGSAAVCDGGVPGINPPNFGPTQAVANALNDFACNFVNVATASAYACTEDQFGTANFIAAGTVAQFCLQVPSTLAFPAGDTKLTVQLRDTAGTIGPRQQIIVRIGYGPAFTFTPTPSAPPFTPPPSATPTSTLVPTQTPTLAPTRTPAVIPTATPSPTGTHPPPSNTPTGPPPTSTRTGPPTSTRTGSPTTAVQATSTATPTSRWTASFTPRPTAFPTATPSRTRSLTPTPTATRTGTNTATPPPTASPTMTGIIGPIVTFVGLTRADDVLIDPSGTTPEGLLVYSRLTGTGFSLVVEAKPGLSGVVVAASTYQPGSFPDLQIEVSRPLGDGSAAVCDTSAATGGGVPAIDPPDFTPTQTNINAVNDLACRFQDGSGSPRGRTSPADSCVVFPPGYESHFVDPTSTIQFCTYTITRLEQFWPGDTMMTVRVRDNNGNVGAPTQFVVSVATPTPTATAGTTPGS